MRLEAYTIFGALFMKKKCTFNNTKLGMKVNIYLGPLPGPWKGPMQVKGPEGNKILKYGSNLLTIIPFFLLQGCIKLHVVPSESH